MFRAHLITCGLTPEFSVAVVANTTERLVELASMVEASGIKCRIEKILTCTVGRSLRGRTRLLVIYDSDIVLSNVHRNMFATSVLTAKYIASLEHDAELIVTLVEEDEHGYERHHG